MRSTRLYAITSIQFHLDPTVFSYLELTLNCVSAYAVGSPVFCGSHCQAIHGDHGGFL